MRFTLLLITSLVIFSCNKSEDPDSAAFLKCHQSQQLDSAGIANKLVGQWSLSSRFCYKVTVTNLLPILVKANFTANGSFSVSENNSIITQGNWKLKPLTLGTDMWELELTSASDFLKGRVLFCKNQVLFNNTYANVNGEGCDVIFFK
jgi:hypothetical protein